MEIKNKGINPEVSVIIPTRNRLELLKIALSSVLSQTLDNIEVLVINDASSDGTKEFLDSLLHEKVRYIHSESALGGGAARNLGISMATGEHIAFLDDDDTWMPDKLERQLKYIKANKHLILVSCAYYSIDENGKSKLVKLTTIKDRSDIFRANLLGGASMYLVRKESLLKYGFFDPLLRSAQDWDLLVRLSQHGEIGIIETPLVNYLASDHLRISNNLLSTYAGIRNIYLKYKKNMPKQISNSHLCTLAFLRFKLSKNRNIKEYIRLIWFSKNLDLKEQSKFLIKILIFFVSQKFDYKYLKMCKK